MKRLVPTQCVVVNNNGIKQVGKIKCMSKAIKGAVFYDIKMENGTEIIYVSTNSEENKTYIDINLTNKMFPL